VQPTGILLARPVMISPLMHPCRYDDRTREGATECAGHTNRSSRQGFSSELAFRRQKRNRAASLDAGQSRLVKLVAELSSVYMGSRLLSGPYSHQSTNFLVAAAVVALSDGLMSRNVAALTNGLRSTHEQHSQHVAREVLHNLSDLTSSSIHICRHPTVTS
jgi:hypothetical protein